MRLKDLAETTSDMFNIPVESITIDPEFNVRTDRPELLEHIERIKLSIKEGGFIRTRPLTVRLSPEGNSVILVDGHCRLTAVRQLLDEGVEIKTLPCVSEPKGTKPADRNLMIFTSNDGLNHSDIEEAVIIKRQISFGWSEQEIANKIGRTRQFVANRLDLLAAPEAIQEMVAVGTISATEAVMRVRKEGAEGATELFKEAEKIAKAAGKTRVTGKIIDQVQPKQPSKRARLTAAVEAFIAEWDGWQGEGFHDAATAPPAGILEALQALREAA